MEQHPIHGGALPVWTTWPNTDFTLHNKLEVPGLSYYVHNCFLCKMLYWTVDQAFQV